MRQIYQTPPRYDVSALGVEVGKTFLRQQRLQNESGNFSGWVKIESAQKRAREEMDKEASGNVETRTVIKSNGVVGRCECRGYKKIKPQFLKERKMLTISS